MKSWQVVTLGEPDEALRLTDMQKPEPGEGEVLIRVKAAALNFFDILQCKGEYQEKPELPFTPGAEIAGEITVVGSGVTLQPGTRVLATPSLPAGGFSEWIIVKESEAFPIPEEMSYEEAAAFFITYQTAYFALNRSGRLKKGEVLLVHAGSGGVGSAAIQLGKAAGAKVIATAGSDEKAEVCRQLGADLAINYRTEGFIPVVKEWTNGKGADVIFDPVGGETFDQSRRCVAFEGRLLVIGFAGGEIAQAPTNHALVKNYSIVGIHYGLFRKLYPKETVKAHEKLVALFKEGAIRPLLYSRNTFDRLPEALQELGSRKTYGKLVLITEETM
ncbi:NADPH:quinone oxidoreductase family protein [Planomicrobium sp. YIM 101495]|uniref:NADPH:quinone oxidoreductase family protein n=1 Tax=Planomicrobium sp. YIM 101495 TaxID=2665160 RepID=UPI0012B9C053|nr:NADPH:quinone oxidoreductase family protein [Planomicrobium sp. YIM 101495]MTD30991.1 zinc-binding dehydrogenase [Planomicrobium sp. YIM 101495]